MVLGSSHIAFLAFSQRAVASAFTSIPVYNKFVYGISNSRGSKKILNKFNTETKKFTTTIAVPQMRSVLQMGKHTFLSGGFSLIISDVHEYNEEANTLVAKASMQFAKYAHTAVAISLAHWTVIGGNDGKGPLKHCEEYSIPENKWISLPPLNNARFCAGSVLMGGTELYVLGGTHIANTIELLDLHNKRLWAEIVLASSELQFTSSPGAYAISPEEILLLCGGSTSEGGIFNPKKRTIKACNFGLKVEQYMHNAPCLVDNKVYFLGSDYGHVVICNLLDKTTTFCSYESTSS